jgi:hypothetical protein
VADTLHISADFFASLEAYAYAMNTAAHEAARLGMEHAQNSLREAASKNEHWQDIAHSVEAWHEDGKYHLGVQNPDHVDTAFKAEYGDASQPPQPLIRHMPKAINDAQTAMNEYLTRVMTRGQFE